MPKIVLATPGRLFIPDVDFVVEGGKTINNKQLTGTDQVKAELSLATQAEIDTYMPSYTEIETAKKRKKNKDAPTKSVTNFDYNAAIPKHVKKLTGLPGIKDGIELMRHDPTPELNELISVLFLRIVGVKDDSDDEDSLSESTKEA